MIEKQKILIVDDDNNIAELVALYLTKECFDTKIANDGEEALSLFASYQPNLILLDLMLPGIDGNEVCRRIRKTSDIPIIMVSAKGEVFDKVLGLELGADDYIIKPFDSKELVARVKAVLRRFHPASSESEQANDANYVTTGSDKTFVTQANTAVSDGTSFLGTAVTGTPSVTEPIYSRPTDPLFPRQDVAQYDDLIIDLSNYSVIYYGKEVEMPPKELELFYFLASHPNQVFTREQLLDHIWGYEYIGDTRTVDVHIKRLREKIKKHENWNIATVWGIGYKFDAKK
jgi:DNA-binding response OmpR family regulator